MVVGVCWLGLCVVVGGVVVFVGVGGEKFVVV